MSRVAMMQVIEEDTHDNYVVCRGYDPESMRFYDELLVAKPYGVRGTNQYSVGEVYAACKAQGMLGDTPGVAETTTGHPADLEEEVDILQNDDSDADIAWILLDDGGAQLRWGKLATNVVSGNTVVVAVYEGADGGFDGWAVYSGYGHTAYCPPTHAGLPAGCWVLIEKLHHTWFITKPHSLHIKGLTTGAVDSSDSTFTIDNVVSVIGPAVVTQATDEITVQNTHDWDADNNATCQAVWNGEEAQWEAVQIDCPA